MLKCIHKIKTLETGITKFVTDFGLHCLFFKKKQAILCDIDGNCVSQIDCRDKMQEGVFADGRAIVATDLRTLYFYNLKERTNKIVKRNSLVHALIPGPNADSFYLGTRRVRSLNLELISTRKENVILRLRGISSISLAIKRFFVEEAEPIEISISQLKTKTYICNKSQRVKVFSGTKQYGALNGFPLPIYRALETPFGIAYFVGVYDRTVRVFDENKKEIFTKELPFFIKDISSAANSIIAICEYGAIFMLNYKGDIIDGGFIVEEIIDCKVSPDGTLWCLVENGSLMIIAQEESDNTAKVNQWLHVDTTEMKSPLQKALYGIKAKDKEHASKEAGLQLKERKVNKKEKDLINRERKLRQESARIPALLNEIKEREKKSEDKRISAEKLEAEMMRLGTAEELCNKLRELWKKADEEKSSFPMTEDEINKAEFEIKETHKLKSDLNSQLISKKEDLSVIKNEASNLANDEVKLSEDIRQSKNELKEIESAVKKKQEFLKNAPRKIKLLEDEEKVSNLKVKELKDNLAAVERKSEETMLTQERLLKELRNKQEELNLILESTEVVKKKTENLPEINELAQKLAKLIAETQMEESNV